MLPRHLLPQILEHREQLLVGCPSFARRSHRIGLFLLLVVVMVESYIDRTGCGDELFSFGIDRQQSVIFDVLVDKTHNQRLADHGSPITDVMVRTGPEPFALVVSVTLNQRGILTDQHAGQVIRLELVPRSRNASSAMRSDAWASILGLGWRQLSQQPQFSSGYSSPK